MAYIRRSISTLTSCTTVFHCLILSFSEQHVQYMTSVMLPRGEPKVSVMAIFTTICSRRASFQVWAVYGSDIVLQLPVLPIWWLRTMDETFQTLQKHAMRCNFGIPTGCCTIEAATRVDVLTNFSDVVKIWWRHKPVNYRQTLSLLVACLFYSLKTKIFV